jgi:hypothetical protein
MSRKRQKVRELNGYRMVYLPEHPAAMTNKSYKGWVFEHVVVMEKIIKRRMASDEVVHHLDGNTLNNRSENLLLMLRSQHSKFHAWLDRGAPGLERFGIKHTIPLNRRRTARKIFNCVVCGEPLAGQQHKYCSTICRGLANRKTKRPSKATLKKDLSNLSWRAIGRKYEVSDNAVRKWARTYGLLD